VLTNSGPADPSKLVFVLVLVLVDKWRSEKLLAVGQFTPPGSGGTVGNIVLR